MSRAHREPSPVFATFAWRCERRRTRRFQSGRAPGMCRRRASARVRKSSMAGRRRSTARPLEWVLALLGLVCLVWYEVNTYQAIRYQRRQALELERAMERAKLETPAPANPAGSNTSTSENPTIERS